MNTSPTWESARDAPAMRHELHFADRVVRCFVDRPPTISSLLADAVSRNRRGEDLVSDGVRLTWADVSERVERLALDLGARGVRPGERVVLLLGNGIEFPQASPSRPSRYPATSTESCSSGSCENGCCARAAHDSVTSNCLDPVVDDVHH